MNTELATKVLQQIELHPETWNQDEWRCETGMCFAGWATALSGYEWLHADPSVYPSARVVVSDPDIIEGFTAFKDFQTDQYTLHAMSVAQHELGINARQADVLFAASNNLDDLKRIIADIEDGGYPDYESEDDEVFSFLDY